MTSFSNKAALPTWNFEYGEWLNSFIIKNNYFNKLKIYLRNFPSCQLILLDFNSIWRIFESRIGVSFRSNGTIINTIVILGGFAGKKFHHDITRSMWHGERFSIELRSYNTSCFVLLLIFLTFFQRFQLWVGILQSQCLLISVAF